MVKCIISIDIGFANLGVDPRVKTAQEIIDYFDYNLSP